MEIEPCYFYCLTFIIKLNPLKDYLRNNLLKNLIKLVVFMYFVLIHFYNTWLQIPNPLFDLAGLTCGHYLIPFWTFFGATLIGKAVIKMHIQQLAVIVAFNEELLDKALSLLANVPFIGKNFQEPLKKYLIEQKQKLHSKSSAVSKYISNSLFF